MTAAFDLTTDAGYRDMLSFLDRVEAECGDELPDLSDSSPRQRAQRLLDAVTAMTPEDWAAAEWIANS